MIWYCYSLVRCVDLKKLNVNLLNSERNFLVMEKKRDKPTVHVPESWYKIFEKRRHKNHSVLPE